MSEISVSHTDLDAAIRHCPYPEIGDIIWVWAQPFVVVHIQKSGYHMSLGAAIPHFQYAEIFVPDLSSFMTYLRVC